MDWQLDDDEETLAEHVYYNTKGSIYVDADGSLHEGFRVNGERVNSRDCYAFDIFIGEIENARMRAYDNSKR